MNILAIAFLLIAVLSLLWSVIGLVRAWRAKRLDDSRIFHVAMSVTFCIALMVTGAAHTEAFVLYCFLLLLDAINTLRAAKAKETMQARELKGTKKVIEQIMTMKEQRRP